VPLAYPLKKLKKIQRKATIWITEAFCMSSTAGIKAIAGLISIHLHLQKLYGHVFLQAHSLPQNHIINLFLEPRNPNFQESHQLSLDNLMPKQQSSIKGPIVDMDNKFNKVFPSFSPFNHGFSLGNCYDLKLELRLHLGKGLREVKGFIEVVKRKDTR